jgi:hypothetical protein
MTKRILLLIFVGIIPMIVSSQMVRKEYYSKVWEKTDASNLFYTREIYKEGSFYLVKDYNRDNVIIMIGEYSSIEPLIENGHFQFFNEFSYLTSDGNYKNGTMTGIWKFYDEIGQHISDINYSYTDTICDTPESIINNLDVLYLDSVPLFNGKDVNYFSNYVNNNLIYPPMAVKEHRAGELNVIFTISKDGNLCDVSTEGSAYKDFHTETKRIVLSSPKWRAGIMNGKPIAMQYKTSLKFFFH